MKIISYVVPALIIFITAYGIIKKINVYDCFVKGAAKAVPLVLDLFPYVAAVFLMSELFEASKLSTFFIKTLSPVVKFLGIPEELTKLILLKPFSGSGSLSLLTEIYKNYGTNSFVSICASSVYGSSETVFYVSAVYFSKCKNKKAAKAILISLFATFFSTVVCCNILKLFY